MVSLSCAAPRGPSSELISRVKCHRGGSRWRRVN
jgi:hypothetical protein